MADKHPGYMTTFKERLSYWTYFIGQNIYYNITAAFISTYLAMQGVNLAKVAIVLLIVKIWDAVNDPIFGFIFDKVKFKNGQKSLPWLRISTALIPIVTIILFSIPSALGETGKLIWFGVAYVLWDTVYTLTDIPAYAMLNTMTDNLPERNTLLSVNRVFSGAGVLIYGVVLPILISENVGMSASLAIATLSIFSALTMVPLSLNCKERNYKPEEEDENFSPRQMFSYLGKNKYLLTYYGGYCATDALKTSAAVTLFVSFYLFGNSLYSIVLNLLNMVPGVFAAMLMPTILKKLDKFKTLFWCNIVNIILGLVIFFVGYENRALFLTLTCVRTIPMSIVGILAFMFTPDCAEYGQYKSGHQRQGHHLRHPDLLREDHRCGLVLAGFGAAGLLPLDFRGGGELRDAEGAEHPAERRGAGGTVDRVRAGACHRHDHFHVLLSGLQAQRQGRADHGAVQRRRDHP